MDKRKLMVWTLISAAISLVIILMTYFGIVRYLSLHAQNMNSLSEGYSKLKKAGENGTRVVVSLTTTPKRSDKLKPMLNSLLDQTVKVDQVALNVASNVNVPKEFETFVNVFNIGKDYGPATKIIPTLLREGERDTIIIYVDDDYIYGKDFIEALVQASKENPDKAIYTKDGMKTAGGVLVKPNFFDKSVINHESDYFSDEWVENHLTVGKHKIDYKENYKSFMI